MFTQSLKIIKSQTCLEDIFLFFPFFFFFFLNEQTNTICAKANALHSILEAGGATEPVDKSNEEQLPSFKSLRNH